ncbi:hypothetical protein RHOER0001_5316 [Rhodococcus erythropolis SK121]|nr:hypothetical protein RHOER0001_5316 [Rhodococcus erythropolis SK121]
MPPTSNFVDSPTRLPARPRPRRIPIRPRRTLGRNQHHPQLPRRNTRTQFVFFSELARHAGYELDITQFTGTRSLRTKFVHARFCK